MKLNSINVWRAHTDIDKLYENRIGNYGSTKVLPCPNKRFLPFQYIRPSRSNTITQFKAVRRETGEVINLLSAMGSNLYIQKGGQTENYTETGITPRSLTNSQRAWGWSIGTMGNGKIRGAEVTVYADDSNNIPTRWKCRILSAKGGTVRLETTEFMYQTIGYKENTKIYFDFGTTYDNSGGDHLYIEIQSNGVWTPVGLGNPTYNIPPDEACSYADTDDTYPDTTDTSTPDEFSGHVKTYEYWGNFDIIVYNGAKFNHYLQPGIYDVVMSDGITTWYFEPIAIYNYKRRLVKITWWNNEPIFYDGGVIRYADDFKFWVYFSGAIRGGENKDDRQLIPKDGRDVQVYGKSYKEDSFTITTTSYVYDAISKIFHNKNIRIESECEEYIVELFQIDTPQWDNMRRFVDLEIIFRSQTTITSSASGQISGEGETNYKEEALEDIVFSTYACDELTRCIEVDYEALDELLETDSAFISYAGNTDDYIIGVLSGNRTLYQWNGSSWDTVVLNDWDVVYNIDDDQYLYKNTGSFLVVSKTIAVTNLGGDNYRADGEALPTAFVQVEAKDTNNDIIYSEVYDGQYYIDNGITFNCPDFLEARIHVYRKTCDYGYSAWTS